MPVPVVNPQNGDDLTAQSITVNVTDKIVAWAGSHESGATTNGALRHATSQIDDAALPESTVYAAAMDQHGRNDTFAAGLSALAGGAGVGYNARIAALAVLPYGNVQAINTELNTNATAVATGLRLVRRRADGSADFGATSTFVGITATGALAVTGNIGGNNIDAAGVFFAGSGNVQITTAFGNLDATKLSGITPAASMPALTGDVTSVAGAVATTVTLVGGVTAANVAAGANAANAAVANGTGNGGKIAKYDVNGGITFGGTVTGTTFVGTFSGTATGVPASGITGQITGSQADSTIAKTANVPTNAGVGATGTWPISITGSAQSVAALAVGTAGLQDLAVTGSKIAAATITQDKIAEGQILPNGGLTIYVNALKKWNDQGIPGQWPGGILDLSTYVPGGSTRRYCLIYVNGSATFAGVKAGNPTAGALTSSDMPIKDPDTTPLGFVALQTGQATIAATDITPWRGPGDAGTGGVGGSGASPVGHRQGYGSESRVDAHGMDEGFPHQTAVPSMQILIEGGHARSTSGINVYKAQSLSPAFSAAGLSGLRIDALYYDPASNSYAIASGVADPTNPAYPAFSGNQRGVAYAHMRQGMSVIKDVDDGTNGWIEDARQWIPGANVSSIPVTVAEGGTGVTSFTGANSGLIFQQTPGATTPLTKINAALGASGFSFAPAISGITGAGTVYGFESAATVATAGTNSAVVAGAHIAAPTVSGGGTQTTVYGALIDGPAYGTNRYGVWVNAGSTTTVGQVVNMPTSSTADNTQYRLNSVIVGNVTADGRLGSGASVPAGVGVHRTGATAAEIGYQFQAAASPTGRAFRILNSAGSTVTGAWSADGQQLALGQDVGANQLSVGGTVIGTGSANMNGIVAVGTYRPTVAGGFVAGIQSAAIADTTSANIATAIGFYGSALTKAGGGTLTTAVMGLFNVPTSATGNIGVRVAASTSAGTVQDWLGVNGATMIGQVTAAGGWGIGGANSAGDTLTISNTAAVANFVGVRCSPVAYNSGAGGQAYVFYSQPAWNMNGNTSGSLNGIYIDGASAIKTGAQAATAAYALFASAPPGSVATSVYAGYFNGTVNVAGTLTATVKPFLIDHPDPKKAKTHLLRYSAIEASEPGLLWIGQVKLRNGKATVDLDKHSRQSAGTLDALVRDGQVFVMCVARGGCPDLDWSDPENGAFTVSSDQKKEASVTWMVYGVRNDPAMRHLDVTDDDGVWITEFEKPRAAHDEIAPETVQIAHNDPREEGETEHLVLHLGEFRGNLIHPEAHGEAPMTRRVTYVRQKPQPIFVENLSDTTTPSRVARRKGGV
jgi:hypothetical protein